MKKTLKSMVQELEGGTAEWNSDEILSLCNYGKGMGGNLRCKASAEHFGSLTVRYLELNQRTVFKTTTKWIILPYSW